MFTEIKQFKMTHCKQLFFLCLIIMLNFFQHVFAQENNRSKCGTMSHLNTLKLQNPGLVENMQAIELQTANFINTHRSVTGLPVVSIPVVFHVI